MATKAMLLGMLGGGWSASLAMAWASRARHKRRHHEEAVELACRTLGLRREFTLAELQARFRTVTQFVRPDHCVGTPAARELLRSALAAHALLSGEAARRARQLSWWDTWAVALLERLPAVMLHLLGVQPLAAQKALAIELLNAGGCAPEGLS